MRMWATFNFVALTGVFRFVRHGQALDVEEEGDHEWSEDGMKEENDFGEAQKCLTRTSANQSRVL